MAMGKVSPVMNSQMTGLRDADPNISSTLVALNITILTVPYGTEPPIARNFEDNFTGKPF